MVTHTLPMPPPILPRRKFEPASVAELEQTRANERFVAAMLETPFCKPARRSPLDWGVSLVLHFVIVAIVVLIPLYFTQSLDLRAFTTTFLVGPPPPPAPAAPPAQKMIRSAPTERLLKAGKLMSPVVIPKQIAMLKEAPITETTDGVIGGVPGGIPGGWRAACWAESSEERPSPYLQRPLRPLPRSGLCKWAGTLSHRARYSRTIRFIRQSPAPRMYKARCALKRSSTNKAMSCRPMCSTASALQAVTQWKYQPTLLNGQPVSIQMTVYVNYHLH